MITITCNSYRICQYLFIKGRYNVPNSLVCAYVQYGYVIVCSSRQYQTDEASIIALTDDTMIET